MDPEKEVHEEVEEIPEVVEEVVQKSFSEMTDDEKMELSDEELAKQLLDAEDEGEEDDAEDSEDSDDTVTPTDEKEDETASDDVTDSEFDRISGMSEEKFNQLPKDKKGIFFEMRSERNKRQEIAMELEKERAVREGQMQVIENMKKFGSKEPDGNQYESEYARVFADIEARAKQYEDETGDEYRMTLSDERAINAAKQADNDNRVAQQEAQNAEAQREAGIKAFQENINGGVQKLKTEGVDWDYEWTTFIEPQINPQKSKNPQLAVMNAQLLINAALRGLNVAEYARKTFLPQTPEGLKHIRGLEQKKENETLLKTGNKKTTKTSAHTPGTPGSNGKIKVDMKTLNGNFKYYQSKLSEDQFMKVVGGGVVHI